MIGLFRHLRETRAGLVRATAVALLRAIRVARAAAEKNAPAQVRARLTLSGPMHLWIPRVYYVYIDIRDEDADQEKP